jgi:hypothetical protein
MSGVAAPSPRPRRVKAPSWLDLRLVLGLAMVLAAVLVGAVVVSRAGHTRGVVAANRDLAAGTVLTADDLSVVQVHVSDRTARLYATRVADVVGAELQRSVQGGELITRAATHRPRSTTTLTVPLPSGAAPALRAGERIELWVSTPYCPSVVLLPDVTVQSARSLDTGFGGGGGQNVVISVAPEQAERVVAALDLDQAHVRAGVLSGPRRGGSGLSDLAGCVSPSPSR